MRCLRVLPFAQEGEKTVDSFAPFRPETNVPVRQSPDQILIVITAVFGEESILVDDLYSRFSPRGWIVLKDVLPELQKILRKLLLNLWKMSLWTVYTSWVKASDLWMLFRVTERVLPEVGGYSQLLEKSRCGWWKREGDCAPKTYSRADLWGWTVAERRHHLPQYGTGAWLRNFQGCKFILFLTCFQHRTRLMKQWTLSKRQISAYRDRTAVL